VNLGTNVFQNCTGLQTIILPVCQTLGYLTFSGCTKLEKVILPYSSVTKMTSAGIFNNTPLKNSTYLGYYGSIYVPASLVDAYKSATNWAGYKSRITAIPEETITFIIGNIQYQAKEWMLWGEWLESEYNTGGFLTDNVTGIYHATGDKVLLKDSTDPIFATSAITSGQEYILKGNE
jgi:hypothetical protein